MPELPEVETIAGFLRSGGRGWPPITGWTASGARLFWQRTLAFPPFEAFEARIAGQAIQRVGRRGKFLILQFTHDALLIHLRMSGDLRVEPAFADDGNEAPFQPHDRLAVLFDNGMRLVFNDPRKFGRAWLVEDPREVTGGLGPEPLDPEFTPELFYTLLRRRDRQIKPLLLDQTFIAGLGNIYTDEALFAAGIHPLRIASTLTYTQAEALWAAIRDVLAEGIRRNGASFDWVYKGGKFEFRVYQQTGTPCPNCGGPIERTTVGQRGTHYCPRCQGLP